MRFVRVTAAVIATALVGSMGCANNGTVTTQPSSTTLTPAPVVPQPSYAAFTQSYTLPWVGSPNFANLTSVLQVQAQVGGAPMNNFTVSTGSTGVVLPATDLPSIPAGSPSQSITYTATGLELSGVVVTETIAFPGAVNQGGLTSAPTATIPVLAVKSATCTGSGVDASTCTTTIPRILGVGFGINTIVFTSPLYNPFLNTTEMVAGTMRRGYIIDRAGLLLGLTTADVGSGFSMQQLVNLGPPAAGTHNDWGLITGGFKVGSENAAEGTALMDTALLDMIVESSSLPQSGTVAAGTTVSVVVGTQTYSFAVNDGGTQTPTQVEWAPATHGNYVNTGIRALAHFDFLYDADNGVFGLRPE